MTLKTALFTVCCYLKKYDTTFAPVNVIYSKVSEIKKSLYLRVPLAFVF